MRSLRAARTRRTGNETRPKVSWPFQTVLAMLIASYDDFFFGDAFFFEDDFFFGMLAPDRRASLRAIATACLRLFTFLPLPDFNFPSFCSFITLWILPRPLAPLRELERE